MKTIVSISPIKVESDSRTFKQAVSFARSGYKSVVVEGEQSSLDGASLPFELRTIKRDSSFLKKVFERLKGNNSTQEALPDKEHPVEVEEEKQLTANGSSPLRALLTPLRLLRFIRGYFYGYCVLPMRHTPRASLYYLHSPVYFPAVYLLSRRYGVPFIYDAHDFYSQMDEDKEAETFEKRFYKKFNRAVEALCIKSAAEVVTVCDGVAELLQQEFGCRPVVVRNSHDLKLDKEHPEQLRQVLNLSPNDFLLVAVGHRKKGLAILEALDAMQKLPARVHLAFIGKDYELYVEGIRDRGLEGRVHLLPPISPSEIVPFIKCADAALILYYPKSVDYLYSLPNKFFQSISAELPLLYPQLPEIKKLAEQYDLGIPIDPQTPESITEAVIQLMNDSGLKEKYRRHLRVAKQELSWGEEEHILLELVSRALN